MLVNVCSFTQGVVNRFVLCQLSSSTCIVAGMCVMVGCDFLPAIRAWGQESVWPTYKAWRTSGSTRVASPVVMHKCSLTCHGKLQFEEGVSVCWVHFHVSKVEICC